ncbi:hypothetical protein Nepgr_032519 [Nepenthes gracilis]|uniref:2-(3-amino-3-carboxypropyl)histidine synthase subunit 2 n=1 Tax=Nepenthes gracilis TaxID=150966 RepID=A0AAD3Y8C8_NEPGR|nr:hypothetical protein Nepgr_032519 [Nepenthes gracilis]
MDVESNYEIDRTANYIFSRKFTRVALQFPDELLKDATKVVRALRQKLRALVECDEKSNREGREAGLFVMADTTYGSCCVDEVGASHINAECVIHYGHTCLSPTSTLPAFFVFGKASISVSNCAETIGEFASSHDKPVLILFGLEYAHAMQDIQETLVAETSKLWRSTSKPNILYAEVLCSTKDPLKDHMIPNGQAEIVGGHKANGKCNAEGETGAGIRYCIGGLTWILLNGYRIEDFLLFWIGPDNSAFTNVVLRFNGCEIVRYDAAEKCLVTDLSQQKRILKRRYYLVEKAKDANIIGILVGTLGVAGYLPMIYQMKELITRAGKKAYTLVMGRPNPAKLANFPECDIFVFVSCEQTALLDSKEFLAPVITPFEAMLAFSRGSQWTGAYTMEFGSLINLPFESQVYSNEARFSFFQGGYVEEQDEKDKSDDQEEVSALAVATEKTLQVRNKSPNFLVKGTAKSGAEYLAARSYQGLGAHDDDSLPMPFLIGRTGKASGYEDEKR